MAIGKKNAGDKDRKIGELRRAQLVTSFGPGAMVDLPDMSVIVGAIDHWSNNCKRVSDRNLELMLGVREFREPVGKYTSEEPTIPVRRFPDWHYCPKCGKLGPFWVIAGKDKKTCRDCDTPLIPSRFVAACENGHLEDFPYRWWVHRGISSCNSKTPLKISFSKETRGIEGILIKCPECGASRSMAGCTSQQALQGHKCFGSRPWIGKKDCNDPEPCECDMVTIQRTASNAYYPMTLSALTIPPTASSVVDRYWGQIEALLKKGLDEETTRMMLGVILAEEELSDSDLDEVIYEIELKGSKAGHAEITRQSILQSEYHALVGEDHDGRQFKTQHVGIPEGYQGFIEDVALVKRLREVMVLEGFRRISPEACGLSRQMSSLSKDKCDWLPGIELLGEGFFVRLNEDAVAAWEQRVSARYHHMERRLNASNVRCDNFSPRYVLLHSLSHALMRQLSMECGYSASSLSERVYSTYPGDKHRMAGILVYTSSSDSDGSLGGLVRRGEPENLRITLEEALASAQWCSSDPLCAEAQGQGYRGLNYAACHACMLLPETSCEMRNCLLDRVSLIGLPDNPELGYFGL